MKERRAFPRFPTRRDVVIEVEARKIEGVAEDMSQTGALVRADTSVIAVGNRIRITFPSLDNATAHAKVVWIGAGDPPRIGLSFRSRLRPRHGDENVH